LKIAEAKFDKDSQFFGSMDPYIDIHINEEILKTKVCDSQGKNPKFD